MPVANIGRLGMKQMRALVSDPVMLVMIAYVFSVDVYTQASTVPETLSKVPIAIVDEDASPLSRRIDAAYYMPDFQRAAMVTSVAAEHGLDTGDYSFALYIPPNFQQDLLAGRHPTAALDVDATRVSQAYTGSADIQTMLAEEVSGFLRQDRPVPQLPVEMEVRARFNPSLTQAWFGAVISIINNVTILSIILTGAALIREREHGTIGHLLTMPVTPFEIMTAKIWSMGLVVLVGCGCSLVFMVQGVLGIHVSGSIPLFLCGAALNIFATTSLGIFLGTIARSMQQFGIIMMLLLIPLLVLSGGMTPRDSMPVAVQDVMLLAPPTYFVEIAQAILYRGAGIDIVWPQFLWLAATGIGFFGITHWYFRRAMRELG